MNIEYLFTVDVFTLFISIISSHFLPTNECVNNRTQLEMVNQTNSIFLNNKKINK